MSNITSVAAQVFLSVDRLEIGMFVSDLDRPWLDTPFLLQGFLIESAEQIKQLRDCCRSVYIDPRLSTDDVARRYVQHITLTRLDGIPEHLKLTIYPDQTPLEQEIPRAKIAVTQTQQVLQRVVQDLGSNLTLSPEPLRQAIDDMVDSVVSNPDAMLWLTRIQHSNARTYDHSIRVALYMMTLGRALGFPKDQLQHLATIGLLLDVGKLKISPTLLEKPGALSPHEFTEVKLHVQFSLEELRAANLLPPEVEQGIAQHHERKDGSGYPAGLRGEQISIYGLMAGIADTFAAITNQRPYANAVSAYDGLMRLYEWGTDKFHAPLVEKFVQAIGIYPVGSLIELNSGEVAAIVSHNKLRRLEPKVMVLTSADKKILPHPTVIDLLHQDGTQASVLKILHGLPPNAYGLNLSDYYLN